MTETVQPPDLKVRHRGMWASGDYPRVARELIPQLGERLVDAAGVEAGHRVLDIAAGTGNAAIPAAARGADVIASDLTPELFEAGRRDAAARGVDLRWEEADAEALPHADGAFDVAVSCVGVMFATMKPFAPAPPPGGSPPPLWGSPDHVRALFGDRVRDLTFVREDASIAGLDSGTQFRDFFKDHYGPTIAVYASLTGQPERAAELDDALAALGDRYVDDGPMSWEYLLVTAIRC